MIVTQCPWACGPRALGDFSSSWAWVHSALLTMFSIRRARMALLPFWALFWAKNPFCNRDIHQNIALFQTLWLPFFRSLQSPFALFWWTQKSVPTLLVPKTQAGSLMSHYCQGNTTRICVSVSPQSTTHLWHILGMKTLNSRSLYLEPALVMNGRGLVNFSSNEKESSGPWNHMFWVVQYQLIFWQKQKFVLFELFWQYNIFGTLKPVHLIEGRICERLV